MLLNILFDLLGSQTSSIEPGTIAAIVVVCAFVAIVATIASIYLYKR